MEQSAYPLAWPTGWPRTPRDKREWGTFEGTPDQVRRGLLDEIDRIALGNAAKTRTIRNNVVISTNLPLRRDGEIYAGAKEPEDGGVAVYFHRKGKPVCLACDKYDKVWKNMRALQKTIEALRGIERWGSSQLLDRAFTGFTALMSPSTAWWEIIGCPETATDEVVLSAYRHEAKQRHPDNGGSHDSMVRLNNALAEYRESKGAR